KLYKENLLNKNMLFVYQKQENQYCYIEVVFEPRHFHHLTGTNITISTVKFFEMCIDNDLHMNDFELASDGTTRLKMGVICELMEIHRVARTVGDSDFKLFTDKLIGNVRGCLGFVEEEGNAYLVPNTMLEYDIRRLIDENNRLMAVYIKRIGEKYYNHLAYLVKGLNPDTLKWTKEIDNKIDKENLIIDFKVLTPSTQEGKPKQRKKKKIKK
ncbi:MAG TPA: PBECR4 domain-containing protein, partial [Anaerovoracaceae bacterium]|nr:PBECR4 domain-containing protein [Anaerovoracaceae bacterium]